FIYHCDIEKVQRFRFFVRFDGIMYETEYWCMPVAVFSKNVGSYVRGGYKLTLVDNCEIYAEKADEEKTESVRREQNLFFKNKPGIFGLRELSLEYRKNHRVWLYYDLYTVDKDNGYYQFINDFKHKDDGVDRYYVYGRELSEIEGLFDEEQKKHLVLFGSELHKLLYLSAEKILTAFYGFTTISPFETEEEEANYIDIQDFETVYLQHGILHAHLVIKNHAERCRAEKIVVSTPFEKKNYMENYGYEEDELICTGMARYDYIDREAESSNRILFAPSWREYLTIPLSGSKWELLGNKVSSSDYYKKFMEFLTDPELYRVLEKKDMHLDFKLHPIIKDAKGLFQCENDRIHMAPESVRAEDYKIFVTDYSSYVFDFVYLKRAIMYFVPDMDQFKSGMNHYRELDLPFEKAFGPLVLEPKDAVDKLTELINRDGKADIIYYDRMRNFFFERENHADGLYDYLIKK
nr:CDP-glycerol glycerophosphotransferase family protein [Lachnospiraceae bacterium]